MLLLWHYTQQWTRGQEADRLEAMAFQLSLVIPTTDRHANSLNRQASQLRETARRLRTLTDGAQGDVPVPRWAEMALDAEPA